MKINVWLNIDILFYLKEENLKKKFTLNFQNWHNYVLIQIIQMSVIFTHFKFVA